MIQLNRDKLVRIAPIALIPPSLGKITAREFATEPNVSGEPAVWDEPSASE